MKSKKKKLLTFTLILGLVFGASSCKSDKDKGSNEKSADKNSKEVVTVWTSGSENVKETWRKLADGFNNNEEYNQGKYEMQVQHVSSGTGATNLFDRVISQYKSGKKESEFDLVEVNGGEYEIYTKEGGKDIFLDIEKDKLKNKDKVKSDQLASGSEQLVPYRGTTVVLAYDENKVKNPPKTDKELYKWIKDNPGQFAYCTPGSGGSGASFVLTSVYNFLPEESLYSNDKKWEEKWDQGFKLLKELHPFMYKSSGKVVYPNKNQGSLDLLMNGQISMTPSWVDLIISQLNQGTLPDSIKMVQIKPSFTGDLVSLGIPKNTKNKDGALAIIDYALSKDAQTILLDEMGAFPVIDANEIDSKNKDLISSFKIEDFRSYDIGNLSQDLAERWDKEISTLE
ncbi:MAG: extracellular solute-binding protein [Peptoniphilaceae bacterium]|nr:extracellular solute-binding protein [Peptoniphilaceae bacterium]MDY6018074.1 extracellular solute-binding protein [Anaerococcus sp.]